MRRENHRGRQLALATLLPVAMLSACGESRDGLSESGDLWDLNAQEDVVTEPIDYRLRESADSYGLPAAGEPGAQSLVDLMMEVTPDTAVAPGSEFSSAYSNVDCNSDNVTVDPRMPLSFEGVVTLHPRQYFKKRICAQDQRFYGSFVVEDDSGGVTILRDSRVANYTFGDRVRITALAMTAGFDDNERIVFSAEITPLTSGGGQVYYREIQKPFAEYDPDELLGRTFRAEGAVIQQPSNQNFGALVVSSQSWSEFPAADPEVGTDSACIEFCRSACRDSCPVEGGIVTSPAGESVDLCGDQVCPGLCPTGTTWDLSSHGPQLPQCWPVNIDAELNRRGALNLPIDAQVSVTGPVVESFGRVILVIRLGQIEVRK